MRDAANVETAARLEQGLPGWVVMWAPYHRRYTAFGACTPAGTIIDAPDPNTLITRARAAQLAAASGARRAP
ncbi:hypothetical protein NE236_07160 [Actinoallomurus purpureus]|uniref:hypothetical protein n=1 Tax=Actinoallomurus purpureus TaxID=478114 RepID=UPI0020926676|nr:hypothetical protein [Actinoallomurus purpureus]MCO6004753.1 hypothetical protein [Actinoallomurus purpureus]